MERRAQADQLLEFLFKEIDKAPEHLCIWANVWASGCKKWAHAHGITEGPVWIAGGAFPVDCAPQNWRAGCAMIQRIDTANPDVQEMTISILDHCKILKVLERLPSMNAWEIQRCQELMLEELKEKRSSGQIISHPGALDSFENSESELHSCLRGGGWRDRPNESADSSHFQEVRAKILSCLVKSEVTLDERHCRAAIFCRMFAFQEKLKAMTSSEQQGACDTFDLGLRGWHANQLAQNDGCINEYLQEFHNRCTALKSAPESLCTNRLTVRKPLLWNGLDAVLE